MAAAPASGPRPGLQDEVKMSHGCFPKIGGTHPKWMIKIMETPIKMDDLGGKPTIFGNIHLNGKFERETSMMNWVGGFKYFSFSTLLGKMIQFD